MAVRVHIKLSPKAARNSIQGWAEDADGNALLKCSVTAIPEKGKANKALITMLAKELGVAKGAISLIKGDTDRNKVLEIDLAPDQIYAAIGEPPSSS